MLSREVYIAVRFKYFGEHRYLSKKNYRKYKRAKEKMNNLTMNDFVKAKKALEAANVPQAYFVLESCAATTSTLSFDGLCCKKQEEENSMYDKSETQTQRDYFTRRLNDVRVDKFNVMADTFRIHASNEPRTYKQLIDAIKNGQYELDAKRTKLIEAYEENGESYRTTSSFDGIKWTLPGAPDWNGYRVAELEVGKKYTTAKDAIMGNPFDGAKIVADFEAWTPTTAAN